MDDEEYLPLSWLSQADYCLRRAALLLNERVWVDNSDTAKGRAEHERVHTQRVEHRGDVVKLYENTVYSDELRLVGKCDCIEATRAENGCMIPAAEFPVKLYPIEYKHGSVRAEREYEIQLCAQAMCLEEMYHTQIAEGALFFITAHRRHTVALTEELRAAVRNTVQLLHQVRDDFAIPLASYSAKCKRCSLREYCMPKVKRTAKNYCEVLEREAKGEAEL